MRSSQLAFPAFLLSAAACTESAFELQLPPGYGDGLAGRAFTSGGTHYAVADFQSESLRLTFDVPAHMALAHAELQFRATETGSPLFRLTPAPTTALLDGQPIHVTAVRDPDDVATFLSLGSKLPGGSDHVLVVEYPLPDVSYSASGVDFATSMLDVDIDPLRPPRFFDAYGPAGIEADQFQLSVELTLVGAGAPHRLFSNGSQVLTASDRWMIEFPDYFSTSSFFFHLTEAPLVARELSYHGLERDIPITVYGQDAADTDDAIARLPGMFAELESEFGPYLHTAFTARIRLDTFSMEYAGAAETSLGALHHELCHSWFGRGVLPADGRSGWIDEAICTWHDLGPPRTPSSALESTNLANFSIWYQETPGAPHVPGMFLMSDLDRGLADQGGLLPILRALYARWRGKPITTEQFLTFLDANAGSSFDAELQNRVYGR
jgi:hypothetical protein